MLSIVCGWWFRCYVCFVTCDESECVLMEWMYFCGNSGWSRYIWWCQLVLNLWSSILHSNIWRCQFVTIYILNKGLSAPIETIWLMLCDSLSRHIISTIYDAIMYRHIRSSHSVTVYLFIVTRYILWLSFCDDPYDGRFLSYDTFYDHFCTLHDLIILSWKPRFFVVIQLGRLGELYGPCVVWVK